MSRKLTSTETPARECLTALPMDKQDVTPLYDGTLQRMSYRVTERHGGTLLNVKIKQPKKDIFSMIPYS